MHGFGSLRPSAWRFVAPWIIVALTVVVFMPAIGAGFVHWDDDDLLENNTARLTFSSENLRWMFTTSFFGHYQPLTWLSYAFDYRLWGGDPTGYHITNVVLHALAAVAFYFVARRLLAVGTGNEQALRSRPFVVAATFAALFFACHPLRAESVAWLAERRDVLSGVLYLSAIGCYLRFAEHRSRAVAHQDASTEAHRNPVGWHGQAKLGRGFSVPASQIQMNRTTNVRGTAVALYVGTFLLCGLSLLAKAIAMTIPAVLIILDVYPLRRLGGRMGWWRGRAAWVWAEKVPFLKLGAAFAVQALIAQQEGGIAWSLAQHDWIARIAQACYGLVFYGWKTIVPTDLGPLYQVPTRSVLLGPMFWTSALIIACVAGFVWAFRRRIPGLAASLVAYAVILSPVLGFAQSGPQFVADRYSYISCLGFAVLAGWGLMRILATASVRRDSILRPAAALVAAGILTLLCHATYGQSDLWRDELRLWTHGARISPNSSFAQCNYADALARAERFEEAYPVYQRTLELDPKDVVALHHFGDLHYKLKKYDVAIEYYRRTIAVDPSRKTVHFILARLLVSKRLFSEAILVLRDGAKRHPDELDMLDYLADILATWSDASLRNGQEAVHWASMASAARSHNHAPYLLTLATALAEAGRFDEAVATIERALPLADASGHLAHAEEMRRRLRMFQERKPYHFGD